VKIQDLTDHRQRAELRKKIDLLLNRLRERIKDKNLTLEETEANEIIEVLELCGPLVSNANLIQDYLELAAKDAEARRVYREEGPRAAARVMGWSTGKRGLTNIGADPPEHFDVLLLYEYLEKVQEGEDRTKAIKSLVKKICYLELPSGLPAPQAGSAAGKSPPRKSWHKHQIFGWNPSP
jgi:hypothetical protein